MVKIDTAKSNGKKYVGIRLNNYHKIPDCISQYFCEVYFTNMWSKTAQIRSCNAVRFPTTFTCMLASMKVGQTANKTGSYVAIQGRIINKAFSI